MVASVSVITFLRFSSFKLEPCVFSSPSRIARADRIWHSQMPPMYEAPGEFFCHLTQSVSLSSRCCLICSWFISSKAFFNPLDAPTKLIPLSDLMNHIVLCLEINLLRVWMKESVSIAFTSSMWTALCAKQVNRAQYCFKSDVLSWMTKVPKISTLQWVNGGASVRLSFGKSAIFWYPNAPRSLQHVTHLKIVLCTTELALITQRPFFWKLSSVILLPLCATFSWHHITVASVIKFAFGKIT